jgi:hypothetical protein
MAIRGLEVRRHESQGPTQRFIFYQDRSNVWPKLYTMDFQLQAEDVASSRAKACSGVS